MSTYRVNIMGERSMSTMRKFLKDESGATAIEYGLIAALVSVVIIAMLTLLGNNLNQTFKAVADNLATTAP
jgi:pilus assembly protein Flp/PilA